MLLVEELLFWDLKCGTKSANFPDFWALLPEPETTSLTAAATREDAEDVRKRWQNEDAELDIINDDD